MESDSAAPVRIQWGRLEDIYRNHAPAAMRLAYLLTGNRDDAADLVQDSFIRIARRLYYLRSNSAFSAYLRQTVTRLAITRARRKRLERGLLVGPRLTETESLNEVGIADRQVLLAALSSLPPRQRAAIVLRYYEDLSEERAAEILGTSPKAVNSLIGRGLRHLRASLKEDNHAIR